MITAIPANEYRRQPWKNGGGLTDEIAADVSTPPDWRLSIATIERSGPFSRFDGYDRTVVAIEGAAVTLNRADGERMALVKNEPWSFRGEEAITCDVQGVARDFNVMTRRQACTHNVEILSGTRATIVPDDDELMFVVAFSGDTTVNGSQVSAGSSVAVEDEERFDVICTGVVAIVNITPVD